jgi:hypothetical protein
VSIHKHGDSNSWCLCEAKGLALSVDDAKALRYFRSWDLFADDKPINLHYHEGRPCVSRLCRKRGTPKVDGSDARLVLAQGDLVPPLHRCPRCKTHLKRGERADLHYVTACEFPFAPESATPHWCCPARGRKGHGRCEWYYVASAKDLKDEAVRDALFITYPAGGWRTWTDVLTIYVRHNPIRFVPPKVFYAKLKRMARAGEIHGCLHSSASTACRGDLHLPIECEGGC